MPLGSAKGHEKGTYQVTELRRGLYNSSEIQNGIHMIDIIRIKKLIDAIWIKKLIDAIRTKKRILTS